MNGRAMTDDGVPLRVRGLGKAYRRGVVLRDVSFDVAPGAAVALLGSNGAGKSTLIGCVTGDRLPDRGEVRIGGADPFADPARAAAALGFVPEQPFLYGELTVAEMLRFVSAARGMDADGARAESARLLEMLGLAGGGIDPLPRAVEGDGAPDGHRRRAPARAAGDGAGRGAVRPGPPLRRPPGRRAGRAPRGRRGRIRPSAASA